MALTCLIPTLPGAYAHTANELRAKGLPLPEDQVRAGEVWLPIIPLCNQAAIRMSPIPREKMDRCSLERVLTLILRRYKSVASLLIDPVPSLLFRIFLRIGQPAIRWLAKDPLRKALIKTARR
jgi:hypothetical protein